MRVLLVLVALMVVASSSDAQVIYEPVQSQYGTENQKLYYGGSSAQVLRAGRYFGLRPLANEPLRVYTDRLPGHNAALYGHTPDDARNDAYNSLPRYFRKRDLLESAVVEGNAAVVPARAPQRGVIEIRPYVRPLRRSIDPVIVIPKSILDMPLPNAPKA